MQSYALASPVLIATLGTNPQVVTLAADMLAEDEHVEVGEVYVLHTQPIGRVGEAVDRLREAFRRDRYRGRSCPLRLVEICHPNGRPVPDIRVADEANAAFQAIFGTVRRCKQANLTIHLSIAGGRNSMVVYGAAAAHILFGPGDRLWHIISSQEFERSGAFHRTQPGDAQLSLVPVLSWNAWLSYAVATWTEDPIKAFEMQQSLAERQEDQRRTRFLGDLSATERSILVAFVHTTGGGTNQQIAVQLSLALRTVEGYFRTIYAKMLDTLELPDDETPPHSKRAILMNWFAGFFQRHPDTVVSPQKKDPQPE